jgi:WD40 repeat protein
MSAASFFITGGTLPPGAPSYVERAADTDLLDALRSGEYCYVLDTRQMGKSSLLVRTAARLREQEVTTVLLDLTAVGSNVTPVEWYFGLLMLLGDQLNLTDELEEAWFAGENLGPMQRWIAVVRDLVLARSERSLVVFVDEIDVVLNLPFHADEFFNGVRECYNRRTRDPMFERLTFCFAGVAAPSDLILAQHVSPFNIGRRVVLRDFTIAEAAPLMQGPITRSILKRVFFWTGGHPYMTQRLCRALAELGGRAPDHTLSPRDVDRISRQLFMTREASDSDNNLAFVRRRLVGGANREALLDLYAHVRRGDRVEENEVDPLQASLILAGIVRVVDGRLVVRNRILATVFDPAWIRANMPDVELRRQQRAYRRGLTRAAAVSTIVIVLMSGLVIANVRNANRAHAAEIRARLETANARAGERLANRVIYDFNVRRAEEQYRADGLRTAQETLAQAKPAAGQPDPRGFEWFYLARLFHAYDADLPGHHSALVGVRYSPDGKALASACEEGDVRIWSAEGKPLAVWQCPHREWVTCIAWSADSRTLAIASRNGSVYLWDRASSRTVDSLQAHTAPVTSVALSSDARVMATGSRDGTAALWDIRAHRKLRSIHASGARGVWSVALSHDGKLLVTGGDDGAACLWEVSTGRLVRRLKGHSWYVYTVAFSPDDRQIATGSGDGNAILWDVASGNPLFTLRGHTSYIYTLAFSHDGRTLATGAWDYTVRLWDTHTGATLRTLANTSFVWALDMSPEGKQVAVGCADGTLRLWNAAEPIDRRPLMGLSKRVVSLAFAPPDHISGLSGDGSGCLWNVTTGARIAQSAQPGIVRATADRSGRLHTIAANGALWSWSSSLHMQQQIASPGPGGRFLAVSPDGARAVVQERDGRHWIFDTAAMRRLVALGGDERNARDFTFSPNGARIAFRTPSRRLPVCDVATGQVLALLDAKGREVAGIAFSNRGSMLACGGDSSLVYLWDVNSGRLLQTLAGHTRGVRGVVFDPDDQRVVTASEDGTVRIWDIETGRELLSLNARGNGVQSVAFSPDGRWLATGCNDGTVALWDAPRE